MSKYDTWQRAEKNNERCKWRFNIFRWHVRNSSQMFWKKTARTRDQKNNLDNTDHRIRRNTRWSEKIVVSLYSSERAPVNVILKNTKDWNRLMMMDKALHLKADVPRFTVWRKEEGRGLSSIQNWSNTTISYINKSKGRQITTANNSNNNIKTGGARGVMVIVVGNVHGDTSSNPGRG